MKPIENMLDKMRPMFEGDGKFNRLYPMFEGGETFLYLTNHKTTKGAHLRDRMDLKRLMIFVDFALIPCVLLGAWNVGYQGFLAEGVTDASIISQIIRGLWHFLPVYAVTLAVGGTWELLFAIVRKHEINEGFLVSSLLFPLTLPPTIPLWMVAMGISFGVVIGKEVFGGVGFNILNPALTARAFVFFTYPAHISGATNSEGYGIWDVGRSWWPGGAVETVADGYTGATPLLAAAGAEGNALKALGEAAPGGGGWTWMDMFLGFVPGSMGEVSAAGALVGAVVLIATGIASWRVIVGCIAGLAAITGLFYGLDTMVFENTMTGMWTLPPHYHLVMGGFMFGAVFMATDPVSSAVTPTGRWIYGALIGVLCGLVRVVNPAYPEGMMLAILFMNVFAPLIDYYVVKASTRRRKARLAEAA